MADATVPPEPLLDLIRELDPSEIVVGIPLGMDGSEGKMAVEARAFAVAVAERTGLPVREWDERLSTARAKREIRSLGESRKRRREKGRYDMVAASLVLRNYLAGTEER